MGHVARRRGGILSAAAEGHAADRTIISQSARRLIKNAASEFRRFR